MLTEKELKKILHYDPDTGIFVWKIKPSARVDLGSIAGCVHHHGYIEIKYKKKTYQAHRLAWLYKYGYFPENDLDHKDRIRHHNWIDNLREASRQCNLRNTGNRKNNSSGVKGVHWFKRTEKWHSKITVDRQLIHLGFYDDFLEAVCHRLTAEQAENWEGCDSSSPAYQYVKKHIQQRRHRTDESRETLSPIQRHRRDNV